MGDHPLSLGLLQQQEKGAEMKVIFWFYLHRHTSHRVRRSPTYTMVVWKSIINPSYLVNCVLPLVCLSDGACPAADGQHFDAKRPLLNNAHHVWVEFLIITRLVWAVVILQHCCSMSLVRSQHLANTQCRWGGKACKCPADLTAYSIYTHNFKSVKAGFLHFLHFDLLEQSLCLKT